MLVMLDTSCSEVGCKTTGYPLHSHVSPSLPPPCVNVCHHVSTELYSWCYRDLDVCFVVTFLATLSKSFLHLYVCGAFLFSVYIIFIYGVVKYVGEYLHFCLPIYVLKYLMNKHQFKMDGQFDLVHHLRHCFQHRPEGANITGRWMTSRKNSLSKRTLKTVWKVDVSTTAQFDSQKEQDGEIRSGTSTV